MGTLTYFSLLIYIMSLMQMFSCQSSKPNIIMIVADDLVSWKFIFSAPTSLLGVTTFSLTFWMGVGWGGAQKKMNACGDLDIPCRW